MIGIISCKHRITTGRPCAQKATAAEMVPWCLGNRGPGIGLRRQRLRRLRGPIHTAHAQDERLRFGHGGRAGACGRWTPRWGAIAKAVVRGWTFPVSFVPNFKTPMHLEKGWYEVDVFKPTIFFSLTSNWFICCQFSFQKDSWSGKVMYINLSKVRTLQPTSIWEERPGMERCFGSWKFGAELWRPCPWDWRMMPWMKRWLNWRQSGFSEKMLNQSETRWRLKLSWNHQMGVSKNRGTPKSSILIGFSIINHPFWGTIIFGNAQIKGETVADH